MATVIISTFLQVAVALLIAGGIWAAFGRGRKPFLEFVGLTGAPFRLLLLGIGIGVIAAGLLLLAPGISQMAGGEGSVAASLRAPGAAATMTGIVLVALLKTSFTEELIFRGLLAKWLFLRLGFGLGNAVQAVIFGAVHLLLLLVPEAKTGAVLTLVLFTAATGWLNGWMNYRLANGSILPGWAAHGTANLLAYTIIAFDWI